MAAAFLVAHPIAMAHEIHAGQVTVLHPAIMMPPPGVHCSCAHLKIRNGGPAPLHFAGAEISVARRTYLLTQKNGELGLSMPPEVTIPAGDSFEIGRHTGCLLLSGITSSLEADLSWVHGRLLFNGHDSIAVDFMVEQEAP